VINDLIADGYWVSKLGLQFNERIKLVLQDDFQVKSVKFSDEVVKHSEELNLEDDAAQFDADFVLMTQEINEFVTSLKTAFDIS
ncbi:MAG: recombination-associated protein RdgC, partial [Kangiellaceae bacterium]|nr:recombination-associated protein RdgC [Kangiellaceae bacterium]